MIRSYGPSRPDLNSLIHLSPVWFTSTPIPTWLDLSKYHCCGSPSHSGEACRSRRDGINTIFKTRCSNCYSRLSRSRSFDVRASSPEFLGYLEVDQAAHFPIQCRRVP